MGGFAPTLTSMLVYTPCFSLHLQTHGLDEPDEWSYSAPAVVAH